MRSLLWFALSVGAALGQPTDLFLLIGQSNMAGRGVIGDADRLPISGVFAFSKDKAWVPAIDPIHFDRPDRTGVGLGRSFASTLIESSASKSVGLIPAAFGGSALHEWAPGTTHYLNAVERVKAALVAAGPQARLRGILWHQGEADANDEERAITYRLRFAKMIAALRKDLAAEQVPLLVGQLGEFVQQKSYSELATINAQLAVIPLHVPLSGFVSSQGLRDKGDQLHFDSPSLKEFGRRYALAWLALTTPK
jgi:hypothetical protein